MHSPTKVSKLAVHEPCAPPIGTLLAHSSLRTELRDAGVYHRRELQSWLKFFSLAGLMLVTLMGLSHAPWWAAAILLPLAAFFATAGVMLGHEGGHGALSASARRNRLFYHLVFPLFSGLGANFWRWKHNQEHHGHPNVEGRDPDIDLWPMIMSEGAHLRSGPARRWFQRHVQGYAFWPLTLLMPQVLRTKSIRHVILMVREGKQLRDVALDVACMTGHYLLWWAVPVLFFGVSLSTALLVWLGMWSVVGVMLAMVFAPAHMGLEVVRREQDARDDPWREQLETTRNLKLPRWLSFFFIGLDYQIEQPPGGSGEESSGRGGARSGSRGR